MKELFTFRPGTCDENVFVDVFNRNQYRLPDSIGTQGPREAILDIGAHIGSFTQACLERGATRVISFEPEIQNFRFLCTHLEPEIGDGRVFPVRMAVWKPGSRFENLSDYLVEGEEINTGGAYLSACRKEGESSQDRSVACASLDEIVKWMEITKIPILKLDCEGAEMEILKSSNSISLVDRIVGEYHISESITTQSFKGLIESLGFQCEVDPNKDGRTGLFFANRNE